MKPDNYQKPSISIELVFCDDSLPIFSPLLQRGVIVSLNSETILRDFLYDYLGLSPEFVESSLSTIFLNGKPVDNIDQASLRGGDTLALSAAMPGLVGATMRRQGVVASFRSGISYRPEERPGSGGSRATLVLKLFNVMIEAVGPTILENGILLSKETWEQFLQIIGVNLWERCRAVKINGHEVSPQGKSFSWGTDASLIFLKISWAPTS